MDKAVLLDQVEKKVLNHLDWNFEVSNDDSDNIIIETPFMNHLDEPINLYIIFKHQQLYLSDDGETLLFWQNHSKKEFNWLYDQIQSKAESFHLNHFYINRSLTIQCFFDFQSHSEQIYNFMQLLIQADQLQQLYDLHHISLK